MLVFASRPGVACVLRPGVGETADVGLPIAFADWDGGAISAYKRIVTQIGVNRECGLQTMHTLAQLVYVYTFGDRISDLRISGISFPDICDNVSGAGETGIEKVLGYYEAHSAARQPVPMQISIGVTPFGVFKGFLHQLHVDIFQPEARLTQFTFNFKTLPSTGVTP